LRFFPERLQFRIERPPLAAHLADHEFAIASDNDHAGRRVLRREFQAFDQSAILRHVGRETPTESSARRIDNPPPDSQQRSKRADASGVLGAPAVEFDHRDIDRWRLRTYLCLGGGKDRKELAFVLDPPLRFDVAGYAPKELCTLRFVRQGE
jgi:hypothetical protein